jgi:hypothetical protein
LSYRERKGNITTESKKETYTRKEIKRKIITNTIKKFSEKVKNILLKNIDLQESLLFLKNKEKNEKENNTKIRDGVKKTL